MPRTRRARLSRPLSPAAAHARLVRRLPNLAARARIMRAVRVYFEAEGFLEVETPARVRAPGQEIHLDAFAAGGDRYLITSPEYHMKRLVAAGLPRVFQAARSFRAEESGPHHQPEFTMLEWYRAEAPLSRIADDCESLVKAAAHAADAYPAPADSPLRFDQPFERVTVDALFERHAGIALRGDETADELSAKGRAAGIDLGTATAYDDVFFQIFLDRIEPHLGTSRPTFVFDWPLPLAALAQAKPRPGQPPVAERFELYAGGLELANAFGELIDPIEQRRRFVDESAARAARGKVVYPIDEHLLAALGEMPPTSGVALGFDRLVMLLLGAREISDVTAFPDEEV
ncbi:MAG TPA: EF-P lysine aminoacylase EpmA [Polyangia bacterium]